MREELQKFSSNNNAMDNKALHSIRSCTHWSHLKELSTLIKFLITSLALTDLLVEVVLTFSIVRRMKWARDLDWTWIPFSSLSLKLTCLVSKLAGYWSRGGHASMGVGCTWEISVPSAQFCFEPETEVKGKFAQSCQTLHPHGLWPARLLCPWNSPSKNTGVNSCSILQGIFPTQGSNSGLLHCRQILYHLSHQGKPKNTGVSLSLLQKMFLTQG